jgi:hypothetical protein
MLVFMIIVIVLIGVAYADYCLIDNTAHFGICFGKLAEAEKEPKPGLFDAVEDVVPPAVFEAAAASGNRVIPGPLTRTDTEEKGTPVRPQRNPAPAWLLPDLEPVLELHEGWKGATS